MEQQTDIYRAAKEGTLERAFSDMIAVLPGVITLEQMKERIFALNSDELNCHIVHEDEAGMMIELQYGDIILPYEIEVNQAPEGIEYKDFFRQGTLLEESVYEEAKNGTEVFIRTLFQGDALIAYYNQLEFIWRVAPDLLFVLDHSAAMKVITKEYISYYVGNDLLPDIQDLYIIHSIYEDGGEERDSQYWFHTHGLLRTGLTEVELIIPSRLSSYYGIPDLFSTFVHNCFEHGYVPLNEPAIIAHSQEGDIRVIAVPWEEALSYVGKKTKVTNLKDIENEEIRLQPLDASFEFLGNMDDRDDIHQQPSCLLFQYDGNDDSIVCFDVEFTLNEGLMFFKTTSETERMAYNAKQSFGYFANIRDTYGDEDEFQFLVKIGIPYAEEEHEHMWFEVTHITDQEVSGILLNEPYFLPDMKKDHEYTLNFNQLTDWVIYREEDMINPTNLYQFLK
ncbi:DUF4026 domain-containing protein [Cytobacillus gottheilii]|uniref:DUF4026 domain-containing protein n=1 Tax=Cytobacillus gottheilii TaxID=859144 RepID=UPI00082C54A6|nr:DUF4026 domain-containing protein [Cytobacillus gottheilii]